ncbi:MAG TPA: hypothetical protein VM842_02740 [Nitrospira sp.]|jgi:hypothetical protein|nr:hypothetical protein [Nitrospira sp.]
MIPSFITSGLAGLFFLPALLLVQLFERPNTTTGLIAEAARTPSPYIGSVMALLATFEDAGILPPEGTSEANGIIKAVIQFQSAFLKSRHPAVQQFFTEAHQRKFGLRSAQIEASFQQRGWSAESFGAVIEAGQTTSAWADRGFVDAFQEFNIGKFDFDLLAKLYRESAEAFSLRGKTFQEVYAQRRQEMPGAKPE